MVVNGTEDISQGRIVSDDRELPPRIGYLWRNGWYHFERHRREGAGRVRRQCGFLGRLFVVCLSGRWLLDGVRASHQTQA